MRGDKREFETRVVPIDESEVVTIVRDATEFRQTERDLRVANERLVQARDAERRRLERNLHDGAQQRLVVSLQALRVAMARLPDGGGGARDLLLRAEQQLALAIEEVREIARGLHPAALTEGGLGPALQTLADRLEGLLPVDLEFPAPASTRSSRPARTTSSPRRSQTPPSTRMPPAPRCRWSRESKRS